MFGDPIIATAIPDRLSHHSTILNVKGESYRLKEKRNAGVFCRPATAAFEPTQTENRAWNPPSHGRPR